MNPDCGTPQRNEIHKVSEEHVQRISGRMGNSERRASRDKLGRISPWQRRMQGHEKENEGDKKDRARFAQPVTTENSL
jgi:hypothetical protein